MAHGLQRQSIKTRVINRRSLSSTGRSLFFPCRTGGVPLKCRTMGTRGRLRQPDDYRSRKRYRMGDEGKAAGVHPDGFAVCGFMPTPAKYFDPQAAQIDLGCGWTEDVPARLPLFTSKARRDLSSSLFLSCAICGAAKALNTRSSK